jgi:L-seryl-tRNA(Ser) seleniumtransferase
VHELLPLAREHDLPILHDLGSGLLIPLDDIGLHGEPTATEALGAGASVVMMSGDKLLGGPQAGLILGSARYIGAMRQNPLARSYRVDKTTLAALEATLALYREPALARREIPALALLGAPVAAIRARAERCLGALQAQGVEGELVDTSSAVGAGAFPTTELPSVAIALAGAAERWSEALRTGDTPVVGRVHDGRLLLDFRAVPDDALPALIDAVVSANG